jgi:uncharacterized protein
MIHLPEAWLTTLYRLFSAFVCPGYEVWAYGSRVTGQHHQGSDLDLVLVPSSTLETQPYPGLSGLKNALAESNLPITVDVMDWMTLPDNFKRVIDGEKVRLWPAD